MGVKSHRHIRSGRIKITEQAGNVELPPPPLQDIFLQVTVDIFAQTAPRAHDNSWFRKMDFH